MNELVQTTYQAQKKAYDDTPYPDIEQRKQDLQRLSNLISQHYEAMAKAISQDYGHRSYEQTMLAEVLPVLDDIRYHQRHVKAWAKTQRRKVDHSMYPGGKNRIKPQPLGVVGLIIPWNFPLMLAFSQISAALSAGNRVMVKMSENSITLTRYLQSIVTNYFPANKICFLEETGTIGEEFSQLPLDLLVFTGSIETGKRVMSSASKNLTPVILELGGKSPAIIDRNYKLKTAVKRIMFSKHFNSGQICTAVDYVLLHYSQQEEFISIAKKYAQKICVNIEDDNYTSIIDDVSFARLQATVDEAKEKGAEIITLCEQSANPITRKFPLTLILNAKQDTRINLRETFGPILLVKTYKDTTDAIAQMKTQERPLALYPFSNNAKWVDNIIAQVLSGGVTVNDTLLHVTQHDLPFGGVGHSGMGHYHGKEGFIAMSKMRPVYYQAKWSSLQMFAPPYKGFSKKVIALLLRYKKTT